MSAPSLYIAAKPPVPGLVKTRLARVIGAESATALYAAFLVDLAATVRGLEIPAGWFIPPQPAWVPPGLGPCQLATRWQRGSNWGERQANLFADCMRDSPGAVLLVASDSPQLAGADVDAALRALEEHDVVVGPVLDGGYYLVGMREAHDLLGRIEMTTERVAAELLASARALGLSAVALPAIFDVDLVADLDLLAAAVVTNTNLRATAAVLATIAVPAL